MHPAATDSLVGRSLEGRYRILERIARGGMSTVYAAVDERLDRLVAVKVMNAALSADPAFSDRFAREARAAARLTHLNAVSVYDQGMDSAPDGQHVFLVMELVEGRTLRELLRERGRLSVPEALSVLEPVLSALAAAHRAGLVHRDVKPENILISDDGVVKVADFGLARAVETDPTSTRTGLMMGTVAYCPPEQIARGASDPRSDVYSAGIVAFELLTGEPPYRGENAMNVAYQHVHNRVPPPSSRATASPIPHEIDELVVAATDSDPAGRPTDASAFLAEIADIRTALALPVTPVPARVRPARAQRVRPPASATSRRRETGADTTDALGTVNGRHDTALDPRRSGGTVRTVPPDRHSGYRRGGEASGGQPLPPPPVVIPPGAREPRRRHGRRRAVITLIVIVLLGVGVGVTAWWFAAGRYSHVPAVRGESVSQATHELRDAGYEVTVQPGPVFDDSVPRNDVLRTSPGAHTRAVRGTRITIVVSFGPQYFTVPNVRGSSADQARTTLQAVSSKIDVAQQVKQEPSTTVAVGQVTRTSPAAGRQVTSKQVITIYVSSGPPVIDVPSISPGTPADAAAATLRDAHFKVSRIQQYSDSFGVGQVIRIDPTDRARENGTITVYVSKGPEMVAVPDITAGSDVKTAEQAVTAAGLVPDVRWFGGTASPDKDGEVLAVEPKGGTSVQSGSTVTIYALPD